MFRILLKLKIEAKLFKNKRFPLTFKTKNLSQNVYWQPKILYLFQK